MYVIFPADELISLTYGLAVPRVPPRPTLDNLREPLVPTGSRPSSTTTTTTTSAPTKHTPSKSTSSSKAPSSSAKSSAAQPGGSKKAPQKDASTRPGKPPTAQTTPPVATPKGSTRSQQQQQQDSVESYELDGPSGTQTLADTSELAAFVDDGGPRNGTYSAATAGTATANASPLGSPKGSGRGGPGREQGPGAKSKSKLQLKLGRLRPHSSIDQCETASRVREDLHIHVSNPVFTRDNLRQRNFDAFFESGEQVYSLEVREKPPARTLQDGTLGAPGGSDPGLADESGLRPAYSTGGGGGGGYDSARPASLGFFRKPKSPLSVRSKSAEHEFSDVETSQKGDDRCP